MRWRTCRAATDLTQRSMSGSLGVGPKEWYPGSGSLVGPEVGPCHRSVLDDHLLAVPASRMDFIHSD